MSLIPTLSLPRISIDRCLQIVSLIHQTGSVAPLRIDLTAVKRIGVSLDAMGGALPSPLAEVVSRYLYLNAVLDQSRDSEGIGIFLPRVVNRMYEELGIPLLDDPLIFFSRLDDAIRVIEEEHARIKSERAPLFPRISGYSLYDQYRVTPWVAFRWGAPLGNIFRFQKIAGGLLGWLGKFRSGEAAAAAVKGDQLYGLGGAIGEKASRLFVKWVAYTARIQPGWVTNSYEVPLDANVGRVLMRTGYLFAFVDQNDMHKGNPPSWTAQAGGRVNLSAQSLNDRTLRRVDGVLPDMLALLARWGLGTSRTHIRIMKTLNVLLARRKGDTAAVGALDDGFMRIGRDFCHNTDPLCHKCPLAAVCVANTEVPELKTTFYCGTGSNVFFR